MKITRIRRSCAFLWVLLAIAASVVIACGDETQVSEKSSGPAASGAGGGFARVRPARDFTVDDVLSAGFKRSKTYDVAGLEHAVTAVYGFYGRDPYNRKEYEIRFYPNHEEAVQYGMPLAEEAVGANAKLTEEESAWDEGLTERRECQGNVRGSHHVGKCLNPKYQDLVLYGNMIILCQGREVAESRQTCEELLQVLPQ